MKKFFTKKVALLALLLVVCVSCVDDVVTQEKLSKVIKQNYMIVNSTDGTPAEVEVSYAVFVEGNDENIVKIQTLTTPFIIGGEAIKVAYDSTLVKRSSGQFVRAHTSLKRDYSPKGAEYLSIKNLSSKMLEYCVVGNNKMTFKKLSVDKSETVNNHPMPVYKGTPVLYLLKPELAIYSAVMVYKYERTPQQAATYTLHKVPLQQPTLGDITLTQPYTLQEVMALYKEEVASGKTLYATIEGYVNNKESIGSNHLFGHIYPNQTLQNNGQVWLLALPSAYYQSGGISVHD